MSKRLLLLAGSYVAFYYLLRVTYDFPNLVHGNPAFAWWPSGWRGWSIRIGEIVFYFAFALIPYLSLYYWYPSKQFFYAAGSVLVSVWLVFFLPYWVDGSRNHRLKGYFLDHLFFVLISFVFGAVFYFIRYSRYHELQQKELQLQNRQSELSFLRSQINPHFLFNSLNNIYSLVYQGSDQALGAIAGLSDLLRYMLYDTEGTGATGGEWVPLQKELDYIRKYMGLQRLRFEHTICADLLVEGNISGVRVAPLLLIPFVENAFKHGDFSDPAAGLTITVHATPKKTYFHCTNRKGKQQKDAGGGIGLENVRRRLELLYPNRHVLLIEEGTGHYSVNLELIHE